MSKLELGELTRKSLDIFEINNISELSSKLKSICLNNEIEYFEKFEDLVQDLSIDYLQKIFQYYEADRKDKGQDYTPACLAKLVGKLSENENESTVLDMCAGSGALTIQKWNLNKNIKFICKEFDEKVIPFLLFNLALRNIEGQVIRCDVLQNEEYEKYLLKKGKKYSIVTEVML